MDIAYKFLEKKSEYVIYKSIKKEGTKLAYKVLIPQDISREGKDYLLECGYEIKMGSGITEEILKREVVDCDAILVRTAVITQEVLKEGKSLKVVSKHGVGVDNIDVDAASRLGIYVTYAPKSNSNSVAEHTIGLVIALARNMVWSDREFRRGDFEIRNKLHGIDLEGKVLGLIGLGRIGSMVAKKAILGLGMKVIGYDPNVAQDKVLPEIMVTSDWKYVFQNSDFISLHLPYTQKTKRIVGKVEFELMKPTSYLINASRGEVLDEKALLEALESNKIAGAALDVFEREPPDRDNPLFKIENVIVTPHNAALTTEAKVRMALHAAIGIDEVLCGKKPSWSVNESVFIDKK